MSPSTAPIRDIKDEASHVALSALTTSTSENAVSLDARSSTEHGEPSSHIPPDDTTTTISEKKLSNTDVKETRPRSKRYASRKRTQHNYERTSLGYRGRRRLELSVSSVCKRSRIVSPPRSDADADAHPFRQQHPGWPALKDLPEACWTHHVFRKPTEFAKVVDQDQRPPIVLASKIYPQRHVQKALCHNDSYDPGENSEIFHGALKADVRDCLRAEFTRAGSFEYRKIAGYEEVILCMAEIYWILFGHWPLSLQREHLYSLPTWLTLMVPCYYEWRNASCRWAPKTKMPQAPSAKRFLSQYPASAQPRWMLGKAQECARYLDLTELSERHLQLPVFNLLLRLKEEEAAPLHLCLDRFQPVSMHPELAEEDTHERASLAIDELAISSSPSPAYILPSQIHKVRSAMLSLRDVTSTFLELVSHCITCLSDEREADPVLSILLDDPVSFRQSVVPSSQYIQETSDLSAPHLRAPWQ